MTASAQLDGRIDFSGTFAQLASGFGVAAGMPSGTRGWCSDLGEMTWNGLRWVTGDMTPIVRNGLPLMILPTSSAVSAAGACTLGTTIPITSGSGFFYVPANYLATVSAAGWYYGTITDGTHVTLFNNLAPASGTPTIPASPTAFSGLSGGTPTGNTGAQTELTVNIPAGAMGPNGEVFVELLASYNNSANNKIVSVKFGTLTGPSVTATTTTSLGFNTTVRNSGQTGVQVMSAAPTGDTYAAAVQALSRGAIDTTAVVPVTIILNNANATDFLTLESYGVWISTY